MKISSAAVPVIVEQTLELEDQPVLVRRAGDDDVPVLYLHGAPTSSRDWLGLLERTGGIAPDLPGFGRSGKRGDLDFTPTGLARFVGDVLDLLEVDRVRLCVHDWGAVGLLWAMEHPERVERIAVIDAVPLLPGFTWHRWARIWRAPMLGEVAVGAMTRRVLRGMLPASLLDEASTDFDQGTQRALLALHRAAPPAELARLGAGLAGIAAPVLVLWGAEDTWFDQRYATAYADALGTTAEIVAGAGHWPWLDRPEAADRIVAFLEHRG